MVKICFNVTGPRLFLVPSFLLAAIAVIALLEWIGGSTYPFDVAAIGAAGPWREAHPQATVAIIAYTYLGSAYALLPLSGAAALWLWLKNRRAQAAALVAAVLATRGAVEVMKVLVDRARPSFETHPVLVHSQSFPSGHAANSMATFLALALFLAPERWRAAAVSAAVVASLAMGATRPLLGVHWPSDVVAGWLLGAGIVVVAWWWLNRRGARSAA